MAKTRNITRAAGSFAPPLDTAKLESYRALAAARANEPVGDVMGKLCDMVALFQQTPPVTEGGIPHPSGRGTIRKLPEGEVQRIWDAVPWAHEITGYQQLFDALPSGVSDTGEVVDAEAKKLRDAAFHLLWYAKELEMDREPITNDQL